jgi:4-hydroxy-3-polyprenylbenzoate decarboxylase
MSIPSVLSEFIKIIEEPLDVNLEIAHIAYAEAKKDNPKILLFKNPIDRKTNKKYDIPVLMNLFANYSATEAILGKHPDSIAKEIEDLIKIKPPKTSKDKIDMLKLLFEINKIFPKRSSKKGSCQKIELESLDELPILKTWPNDGGKFITMGQVYTKSLDGKINNVGMYRLQVFNNKTLGMHWQIHKDSNHLFHEYKKAHKLMPVSIAIGGDPLYTWCATAPLPHGIFELLMYGFIRKNNPKLVKSLTNDIYIPEDADIVIEGFVETDKMMIEGEFGDHTGYYTPKEPYPYMNITKITTKSNPIFYATVVGKPPLEDKYMGWATERIFLPLIKMQSPDLIDYKMPENGVFHNLILCKILPKYPGHSLQIMHSMWGSGQMSFVKHAIFVDESAPQLDDFKKLSIYVLNRLSKDNIIISKGIVDALDHSSPKPLVGGKLGIDATGSIVEQRIEKISDEQLFYKVSLLDDSIVAIKQYCTESKNPITIIQCNKNKPTKIVFEKIRSLERFISIAIFIDEKDNDINNPYMLIWRITNNIDAQRDIWIKNIIGVDATNKNKIDGFEREWPNDVVCDKATLDSLQKKGLINLDNEAIKKFGLI